MPAPEPFPKATDTAHALVIGRAGLDLYPLPAGTKTRDAESFMSDMGGSAGNIAAAMVRAGARVVLAAPVSDDPVGRFVQTRLQSLGITHLGAAQVDPQARTTLALAELIDQGSETVIYRNNAADFALATEDLGDWPSRAALTLVTGTALARDPSRTACLAAMSASPYAVLDLDYRPYSWAEGEASTTYQQAATHAQMIVGNDEEFHVFAPDQDPRETALGLARSGKTVLFKEGARGCSAMLGEAPPHFLPAYSVKALKPFGAGDAFLGNLLASLFEGATLDEASRNGAAAAALVVQRPGCASAMPTPDEIQTFRQSQEAP